MFICKRKKPLCNVLPMTRGNQPIDDGNLILILDEKIVLEKRYPILKNLFFHI